MSPWAELLYRAIASPYGIIVTHEKPEVAVAQFRAAQRKQKDPALSAVSFTRLPSEPDKIYLVAKLPEEFKDAQG